MFRRGKQHALLHQTRSVTDASNVPTAGLNKEIVQVGPAKDDARIGRGREQPNVAKYAGVKANPFRRDFALDGRLKHCGQESE